MANLRRFGAGFVRGFRFIGIIFDSQVAKSLIIKNSPLRHVWYGLVSRIVELFVEFSCYRVSHVHYEVHLSSILFC